MRNSEADRYIRAGLEAACDLQNWLEDKFSEEELKDFPTDKWNAITNGVMALRDHKKDAID